MDENNNNQQQGGQSGNQQGGSQGGQHQDNSPRERSGTFSDDRGNSNVFTDKKDHLPPAKEKRD